MWAESTRSKGLSKAKDAKTHRTGRGGRPLGLAFIAPAEAQRLHMVVPHIVTVRHIAHYRIDLALSPEKACPANGRGRIRGRIFLDAW
jgi:hypothetical protein